MVNKDIKKTEARAQARPDELKLKTLSITNFRAFRRLEIKRLGQANLIVGKNNVGKTCLLEALWLYASYGSPEVIKQILMARNELATKAASKGQISAARNLFYGRGSLEDLSKQRISIGMEPDKELSLRLISMDQGIIKQLEQAALSPNLDRVGKLANQLANWGLGDNDDIIKLLNSFTKYQPRSLGEQGLILAIRCWEHARIINESFKQIIVSSFEEMPVQFVPANGLSNAQVAQLWDKVYLTPLQDDVEEALRIIEPDIRNVGLVKSLEKSGQQIPQVRLSGQTERVLLSSLGEGMNRIFGLALALVNARDGFLLVDEIGNGIHYSVQPRLWDFILTQAQRLNVQVFATTHSWDAVEAFQQASQSHQEVEGMLISLRSKQGAPGEVVGTLFNEEDLAYVTQEQIEVR